MIECPRKAMVMAAGLGLRMRPLTEHTPKPLISVRGTPLIDRVLDWLAASGIEEAVVNTHYLAPMLEAHLSAPRTPAIRVSREDVLLETGGGVKKALPLLGDGAFFVTNSDSICINSGVPALSRLHALWDERTDVVLLLQPKEKAIGYEGAGDFFLNPDGSLRRRGDALAAPFVFTGVQLLHSRMFGDTPDGAFSLNRLYDRALEKPGALKGLVHDGDWLHVGDAAGLALAERYFA